MDKSLAISKTNGSGQGFSLAVLDEQLKQVIPILRELVVNGKKLTDEQIKGRAVFAISHGLDAVTEVNTIVDKEGKTMSHSMHIDGYRRKYQEQAGTAEIHLDFVELPPEALKRLPNALIGYECRLTDGVTYTAWQRRVTEIGKALREATGGAVSVKDILDIAGRPPVFTGVGIVYSGELNEWKDRNFNPIERAKKRAETNARKKRFPTNAPIFDGGDTGPVVTEDDVDGSFAEQKPGRPVSQMSADEIMGQLYSEPQASNSAAYTREDAVRDQQPEPTEPVHEEEPQAGDWKEIVEEPAEEPPAPIDPLRYQPEQLKQRLAQITAINTTPLTDGKKGLVATVIESVLSYTTDPKASRKQLLVYLIGKDSLSDATDNEVMALYKWLNPSKDEMSGEWFADSMAAREAVAAFNAAQPNQTGLF